MKRLFLLFFITLSITFSSAAFARDSYKVAWSIYVGWMPWSYAADKAIIKKWEVISTILI